MVAPSKAERSQVLPAGPGQRQQSYFLLEEPLWSQLLALTVTSRLPSPRSKSASAHPMPSAPPAASPPCAAWADRNTQEKELRGRVLCSQMVTPCSAPGMGKESQAPSWLKGVPWGRGEEPLPLPTTHGCDTGCRAAPPRVSLLCTPGVSKPAEGSGAVWGSHSLRDTLGAELYYFPFLPRLAMQL